MKSINTRISFLLIAFAIFGLSAYGQTSNAAKTETTKQFRLIPVPKEIKTASGNSSPARSITSVYMEGNVQLPQTAFISSLKKAGASGKGVVTFRLTDSTSSANSAEGYSLTVNNGQATITATSKAGLLYGSQTLSQLVQDAVDKGINIPAYIINDKPDVAYRAIHLDLKHHLDSLSYYYRLMDRLAELKINAVILEFEDKLKYKGAPKVGASHAISIEDFKELSDYAHERNIEISPLIQGLGHASFILKHDEYKELRDDSSSDWSFDPLNPKTYEVQFSLYDDAIAATPHGKYLHVGGDEVGKLGMSDRAKKSGLSALELQMTWLKKVCDYASQHNRIPIFWDDMVFKLSGLYETTYDPSISAEEVEKRWAKNGQLLNEKFHLFPKNCMYMRWNYDHPGLPGNQKAIDWYKKNNLSVIAATSGQQIWANLPRASSNFQAVKDFSRMTAQGKLDGILLTLWDDASPHFETFWQGIHDFALFTWNYKNISRDEAHAMFRHRFYGPALADKYYSFQDTLEQSATFWETALIGKGQRENYPAQIDTLTLPDKNMPGNWTKSHASKLSAARAEIVRYKQTKSRIEKALNNAKRNKFALEIFNQINELQVYPAELLLKLEKYDLAKTAQQKSAAAREVRAYTEKFSSLRKKQEEVYSRSRILHNPADYILDQNHHHHLANGTINNDWMYVYELALNEKIKNNLTE